LKDASKNIGYAAMGYFERGPFAGQLTAPTRFLQAGPNAYFAPMAVQLNVVHGWPTGAFEESEWELIWSIALVFSMGRNMEKNRAQRLRHRNLLATRDRLRTLEIRHGTSGRAPLLLKRSRVAALSGHEEEG